MTNEVTSRKQSHLAICIGEDVSFHHKTTFFEHVELVHQALPEIAIDDVDTSGMLFGKSLRLPFLIGAMTGGTGDGASLNRDLAAVANDGGVGMCLGSIRPVLEHPALMSEFQVRDVVPDVLLLSNIGAGQIHKYTARRIVEVSKELGADGLMVHLNAGMELVQPGGDRDFTGQVDGIAALVAEAGDSFEVAVKETGMGLSYADGIAIKKTGVKTVETGSAGGTSWAAVESFRSDGQDKILGEMLRDFGVPTAVSCAWMVEQGFNVVASGGVKDAMDLAKALAMGADAVAMARPVLQCYDKQGTQGVRDLLALLAQGLRYIMVCCGVDSIEALRSAPVVQGAALQQYISQGKRRRGL